MKKLLNLIVAILIVGIMSACTAGPPWAEWMFEGPPKKEGVTYPPLYVKGWQDGCHTGTSGSANHWYKFNYKFTQDWQLAQNRVYYKGWKDAFDYCQRYIYQYTRRGLI